MQIQKTIKTIDNIPIESTDLYMFKIYTRVLSRREPYARIYTQLDIYMHVPIYMHIAVALGLEGVKLFGREART